MQARTQQRIKTELYRLPLYYGMSFAAGKELVDTAFTSVVAEHWLDINCRDCLAQGIYKLVKEEIEYLQGQAPAKFKKAMELAYPAVMLFITNKCKGCNIHASDVVNQVCAKAMENWRKFTPNNDYDADLRRWLCKSASNYFIDTMRYNRIRMHKDIEHADSAEAIESDYAEAETELSRKISKLPDRLRELTRMLMQEHDLRYIAKTMKVSFKEAKEMKAEAFKLLQALL